MIEYLEILNFRALRSVRSRLGGFQALVGPNATGKSSFFDSLSFIRDLLDVGLEKAVTGDPRIGIPHRADNLRELSWLGQGGYIDFAITAGVPHDIDILGQGYAKLRYEISIDCAASGIDSEALWLIPQGSERPDLEQRRECELFPQEYLPFNGRLITKTPKKNWRKTISKTDKGYDYFRSEKTDWNNQFKLGPRKAALGGVFEDPERFPISLWFRNYLKDGVFRVMLNTEIMRMPASVGMPSLMLTDGSNLPWVVHRLEQEDPERLKDWIAHVRTALPDLKGISTVPRQENNSRYIQLEYSSGLRAPSWVLSDGTLRILAITLLAYMKSPPSIILVEEPENGIHPKAIETVMQSLSSIYGSQVFCASHSPLVLGLIDSKEKLLCFGKNPSGSTDIIRGDDHPELKAWKSGLRMSDLFATGIL